MWQLSLFRSLFFSLYNFLPITRCPQLSSQHAGTSWRVGHPGVQGVYTFILAFMATILRFYQFKNHKSRLISHTRPLLWKNLRVANKKSWCKLLFYCLTPQDGAKTPICFLPMSFVPINAVLLSSEAVLHFLSISTISFSSRFMFVVCVPSLQARWRALLVHVFLTEPNIRRCLIRRGTGSTL